MSVHQKPNGKWVVRHRVGTRQRSKTFDRKKDAQLYDGDVRRRAQLGTLAVEERGTITLDRFVADTWMPMHAAERSQRTQRHYAGSWRAHVRLLADHPLRSLTVPVIEQWRSQQLQAGAGRESLTKATQMLGNILQLAVRHEELTSNPVRSIPALAKAPKAEIKPLAPTAIELIRAQMSLADATLVSVLAYSGLRPSEAHALRWGDVGNKTLHVRVAADRNGDEKATKTGRTRSVRLIDPVRQDLAAWRLASGRPDDEALVFPSPRGDRQNDVDRNNWRSRIWLRAYLAASAVTARDARAEPGADVRKGPATPAGREAARLVGLPPETVPRVYDLRHSFASLLLASGLRTHTVARELGNRPSLVEDTYGHVIDEFDESDRVDPVEVIRAARGEACSPGVPRDDLKATG